MAVRLGHAHHQRVVGPRTVHVHDQPLTSVAADVVQQDGGTGGSQIGSPPHEGPHVGLWRQLVVVVDELAFALEQIQEASKILEHRPSCLLAVMPAHVVDK